MCGTTVIDSRIAGAARRTREDIIDRRRLQDCRQDVSHDRFRSIAAGRDLMKPRSITCSAFAGAGLPCPARRTLAQKGQACFLQVESPGAEDRIEGGPAVIRVQGEEIREQGRRAGHRGVDTGY